MKHLKNIFFLVAVILSAACDDDDNDVHTTHYGGTTTTENTGSTSTTDYDIPTIEFDESPLEDEAETIPADDNDYVENSEFSHQVYVTYDGSTVSVNDSDEVVTIVTDGAHVSITSETKKVEYVLRGESTDGSFKIYSENKFKLRLDGLTLHNPLGAAINSQCKKTMYVVLDEGSENMLSDGSAYITVEDEDMKGTVFSEGQIVFSGNGTLDINANCKNGIASDDYLVFRPGNVINITAAESNGIKANDSVCIRGGVLNVGVEADGSKGINSEGNISVTGGRTTLIVEGGTLIEDNDTQSSAGVKADSMFVMTGGELNILNTGDGGKGINCDNSLSVSGGELTVVTTGKEFEYGELDASPKGIKADETIVVSGGDITVACTGGDGAEGIESKGVMDITGGDIVVHAYDDALNASERISISGGNVFAYASDNDGIDSNGTLYISGGVVIACGTGTPEGPFDCDNSTFAVMGGVVIGLGGESSIPTTAATTQPVILLGGESYTKNEYIALCDASGNSLFSFQLPRTYSNAVLVVSSPEMSVGETYTILSGVSVSGGESWQGYSDDATVSGGTSLQRVKVSSYVTTSGSSNSTTGPNMNGGFGGRW